MRITRVGVISTENYIKRTIDIAAGRYKVKRNEPTVWFSSMKSCSEVLCSENIQLIDLIVKQKPSTMKELEILTHRKQGNLNRTLRRLERYNLIKLVKEGTSPIRPEAETSHFEIVVNPDTMYPSSPSLDAS